MSENFGQRFKDFLKKEGEKWQRDLCGDMGEMMDIVMPGRDYKSQIMRALRDERRKGNDSLSICFDQYRFSVTHNRNRIVTGYFNANGEVYEKAAYINKNDNPCPQANITLSTTESLSHPGRPVVTLNTYYDSKGAFHNASIISSDLTDLELIIHDEDPQKPSREIGLLVEGDIYIIDAEDMGPFFKVPKELQKVDKIIAFVREPIEKSLYRMTRPGIEA